MGIIACGMTYVIVAGEIDISVGSLVAFSSALLGVLVTNHEFALLPACLLVLACGALSGALTGFMRVWFNVPSFITTLALYLALRGLAQIITGSLPIIIRDPTVKFLGSGYVAGIPIQVLFLLAAIAITWFVATLATFGRSVYATGGNAPAAKLAGIAVNRVRVAVFVITGVLAAVVGILLSARLGSGNANIAAGLEFEVIAAVIVGGTSLAGGSGNVLGTFLGVIFITVLSNILVLKGVDPFAQDVVRGGIVLLAVLVANVQSGGHWPSTGGVLRLRRTNRIVRETLALLGETISPSTIAGELGIAEQQIVEIAHALSLKPRVLVLDEPTSSLPAGEVDALLDLVGLLRDQGLAIIYVSHRMDEIARVADSVTVLRDGAHVATLPIAECPVERTAELMIGRDIGIRGREEPVPPGEPVALELEEVSAGPRVRSVSLRVREGEILGIAGLLGSGRTELLKAIAGMPERPVSGTLSLAGKVQPARGRDVRWMLSRGVALVPEDRKSEGLVVAHSIRHNLSMSALKALSRFGVIGFARERTMVDASRRQLSIKAQDLNLPVASLSGGNQQNVVIGRCLNADVDVLLLDEPTRGVDVQAKEQIYSLIRELAAGGTGIVFVSSEYEELLLLCHRVSFMKAGRIVNTLETSALTMDAMMRELLSSESDVPRHATAPAS